MKTQSHKHKAEIIEVYEGGLKAAVKFSSGRIECVVRRGTAANFEVGTRGMVDFVPCLHGFEWSFTPAKVAQS